MTRRHRISFALSAFLCAALLLCSNTPGRAATANQDPPAQTEDPAVDTKTSRQAAKEARIAEYLRKREERRLRRDQRAAAKETERKAAALEAERKRMVDAQANEIRVAEKAHATEVASAERAAKAGSKTTKRTGKKSGVKAGSTTGKKAVKKPARSKLPRGLARAQQAVRASRLGQDPSMQQYLDMVDRQEASPQQLGAIGNFLAQAGMPIEAMDYYGVALGMDKKDPVLWVNRGTLNRQAGRTSQAVSDYLRALSFDSNNAVAHYNLGASYDDLGKYEEALNEYKIALRLDPNLGDPAINPQAANNEHLIAVKLLLYKEQAGSLGIPLVEVPGGNIQQKTAGKSKN